MASNPGLSFSRLPAAGIKQAPTETINKADYAPREKSDSLSPLWQPAELRPPPAFYPLEKSTRLIEDVTASIIARRLTECLRNLSVRAIYNDADATASLLSAENVEMHLSLWQGESNGVRVEIQRRKGDSIAFYRYSRSILDAAAMEEEDEIAAAVQQHDTHYSKKVQRLLTMDSKEQEEHEYAVVAIEIAHGLLMKDRLDATQLGLESLCLLTDPRKTGYVSAVLTAHAVLLGSIQGVEVPGAAPEEVGAAASTNEELFREIRQTVLNLVQFSRVGVEDVDDEEAAAMAHTGSVNMDAEHLTVLHNLALAVLANALDVIENVEHHLDEGHDAPEDSKPRPRLRTSSSTDVAQEFMSHKHEILATLMTELRQASDQPHNAHLSAKCLGSLCRASEEARRKAQELGAKQVIATALDVGVRTHLKLETECKKVETALQAPLNQQQQP